MKQLLPNFAVLKDLLEAMLKPLHLRIKPMEMIFHPLFQSPHRKLAFLIHASDYIQVDWTSMHKLFLNTETARTIRGDWYSMIKDPKMLNAIDKMKEWGTYQHYSICALVKVIRNLAAHEATWEASFKAAFSYPEKFEGYFRRVFPDLFLDVYKLIKRNCSRQTRFNSYFREHFEADKLV